MPPVFTRDINESNILSSRTRSGPTTPTAPRTPTRNKAKGKQPKLDNVPEEGPSQQPTGGPVDTTQGSSSNERPLSPVDSVMGGVGPDDQSSQKVQEANQQGGKPSTDVQRRGRSDTQADGTTVYSNRGNRDTTCPLKAVLGDVVIHYTPADSQGYDKIKTWLRKGCGFEYIIDVSEETDKPFFQIFSSSAFPGYNPTEHPELELSHQRMLRERKQSEEGYSLKGIANPVYKGIEAGDLVCIDWKRKLKPLGPQQAHRSYPRTLVVSIWGKADSTDHEKFLCFEYRNKLKPHEHLLPKKNIDVEIYEAAKRAMLTYGIPIVEQPTEGYVKDKTVRTSRNRSKTPIDVEDNVEEQTGSPTRRILNLNNLNEKPRGAPSQAEIETMTKQVLDTVAQQREGSNPLYD